MSDPATRRRNPESGLTDADFRRFRTATTASADAPTYVLLHGVGMTHRSFGRLARELAASGHILAFDLPGFGATPHRTGRLSVEDYAAAIAAQLDLTGTGPSVVIGHSMGAQFALELARQRPDLVERLVLIAPVVDSTRRTLWQQAISLAHDSALEKRSTQLMTLAGYLSSGMRWFLTESVAMLAYPTQLRIADVTHPVLFIRGEFDPIARADWTAWLSQQVADGEVVTIAGNRHNVLHSDPVGTAAAIAAFATR